MPDKPATPIPAASGGPAVDRMSAARAARKSQATSGATLPEATKFAIRQTHAAAKVSRLLADRLKDGLPVSPGLMKCLGDFVTIGSAELFS